MEVRVLSGQSLFDLAVQEMGSIEGVFALAEAGGLSITGELEAGAVIPVPLPLADAQVAGYYAAHRITPATDTAADIIPSGVEFWGIEYDFEVS